MDACDEPFTEAERKRLLHLAMAAVPNKHGDPELTAIIAKLGGVDTVLVAHRAYPSQARTTPCEVCGAPAAGRSCRYPPGGPPPPPNCKLTQIAAEISRT